MFVAISGPMLTGKSTIAESLKSVLPAGTVFIPDLFRKVWDDLVRNNVFTEFYEVTKDRDYLYTYIFRVITEYNHILENYKDHRGLVILDGCYLDYFIYSSLQLWYHYPIVEQQESLTLSLLEGKDIVSRIYMTTADDENHPLPPVLDIKTKRTSFLKNRKLELGLYDMHRDIDKVVTLPTDPISCAHIIKQDLEDEGLL